MNVIGVEHFQPVGNASNFTSCKGNFVLSHEAKLENKPAPSGYFSKEELAPVGAGLSKTCQLRMLTAAEKGLADLYNNHQDVTYVAEGLKFANRLPAFAKFVFNGADKLPPTPEADGSWTVSFTAFTLGDYEGIVVNTNNGGTNCKVKSVEWTEPFLFGGSVDSFPLKWK